jgi:hypothetical protein
LTRLSVDQPEATLAATADRSGPVEVVGFAPFGDLD